MAVLTLSRTLCVPRYSKETPSTSTSPQFSYHPAIYSYLLYLLYNTYTNYTTGAKFILLFIYTLYLENLNISRILISFVV